MEFPNLSLFLSLSLSENRKIFHKFNLNSSEYGILLTFFRAGWYLIFPVHFWDFKHLIRHGNWCKICVIDDVISNNNAEIQEQALIKIEHQLAGLQRITKEELQVPFKAAPKQYKKAIT